MRYVFSAIVVLGLVSTSAAESVAMPLEPLNAEFRFTGPMGRRIDADVRNWLLRAPAANPGMLAMFRLRDRQPPPNLTPWAGEFVGKYLLSAIETLSLSDDPELEKTVRAVVAELIATQADDGYLGPFPQKTRLLGNWDLWGHYHAMLALLAWHERTGDPAALACCRKAGDLVCRTFLDTGRRPASVGSDEMNLAVIHALGRLHRKTGEPRYLQMMREIEKDWQQTGDYLRTGLAGVEYHRIPRPRWESLHDLQGLVELYAITGHEQYRQAFLHHWQSIRRWDRHNNGAFSSGEQATGNPYDSQAIETCCTVAWMAITVDALRLTGDPLAADELELSTWNGLLGAQHPSGSWYTYNTPMDGRREASHHSIVFQARAGTPDLNCCSVNGPRGLSLLSDWAVMRRPGGLTVNYYGPGNVTTALADGATVRLRQETAYPRDGKVRIRVEPERPAEFELALRIPGWSEHTALAGPEGPIAATPGTYAVLRRTWKPGDEIVLDLDFSLRMEPGDLEAFGKASVYRGPLLLAYDQRWNAFDRPQVPTISPEQLRGASVAETPSDDAAERVGHFAPIVLVDVPLEKGTKLRLCDFATAGVWGCQYASWLPAKNLPPPPPVAERPFDGARVPPGAMIFTWRRPAAEDSQRQHRLTIEESASGKVVLEAEATGSRAAIPADKTAALRPGIDYRWRIAARNPHGETASLPPGKSFQIDAALPPLGPDDLSEFGENADGLMIAADLAGDAKPRHGHLLRAAGALPAPGIDAKPNTAMRLDGAGMLVYAVRRFPSHQYTVALWVAHEHGDRRLAQVLSAWDHVMDDPLRICLQDNKLYVRIEAGSAYSTAGVAFEPKRWRHVAVVKDGPRLTLYLDGQAVDSAQVPGDVHSAARDLALGGNPHYTAQSEHLACRVASLRIYCRALSAAEIQQLLKSK